MKRAPAFSAATNWPLLSTVPAPTIAPSTSPAIAAIASSAAPVRSVISITFSPPATSARASGTAAARSSMTTTGMTGAAATIG